MNICSRRHLGQKQWQDKGYQLSVSVDFDFLLVFATIVVMFMSIYLHFQSKPLLNLKIFATVHSLMNDTSLIDSCHAHLPV